MQACAKCGTQNEAKNKFCIGCGHTLAASCHNCGAERKAGQKFCSACGTKFRVDSSVSTSPSLVSDGEWLRSEGEFLRKVSMSEMKSAFQDLVGETGILGRLTSTVGAKSIRPDSWPG